MSGPRGALATSLAVLLLALGGCGEDGGGSDAGGADTATEAEAPSKDEFIEQGDEICMEFDEVQEELEADIEAAGNDTDELAALFEEFADEAESTADELEELGAPEGQEDEVEEYISDSREQIDQLRDAGEALADGDTERFTSIVEEGEAKGDELQEQAEAIGFQECGDDSS